MLTLSKFCLVALALAVGSRGPVKYSNVTVSKVKKDFWNASATYPKFQATTATTRLANEALAEFSAATLNEWATDATKDMEKPSNPWLEELTPTVVMAHPDLISLKMAVYSYSGGAHPNSTLLTFNFGVVDGVSKKLTLAAICKRGSRPLPLVSKIVIAKLKERHASGPENGDIKTLDAKAGDEFVIKSDRLTYIFSPDEMGSHAEGAYEIDVPFTMLAGKLDPEGPLRDLLRR